MKRKNKSRVLWLGKATIANLEKGQMNIVRGGEETDTCDTCTTTECTTYCKTVPYTNCIICETIIGPGCH